jgi:hypothetical protein
MTSATGVVSRKVMVSATITVAPGTFDHLLPESL